MTKKGFKFNILLNFWGHRWMRTLPPYYFVLILSLIYAIATRTDQISLWEKFKYFIFMQNFNTKILPFFDVSWSLCIEEWFYLLTPFILFLNFSFLKLTPKVSFIIAILLFLILGHYFRIERFFEMVYNRDTGEVLNSSLYISNYYFRTQVITRADSVVYGIIGAFLNFYYKDLWFKNKYSKFLISIFLIFFIPHILRYFLSEKILLSYNFIFSYTILGIGISLLLPLLQSLKARKGFIYKSVTMISLVSYSCYLIHLSIIYFTAQLVYSVQFNNQRIVLFILSWVFSLFILVIMYRYLEKPSMDVRKKILTKE